MDKVQKQDSSKTNPLVDSQTEHADRRNTVILFYTLCVQITRSIPLATDLATSI
jgi:hypothetical protein